MDTSHGSTSQFSAGTSRKKRLDLVALTSKKCPLCSVSILSTRQFHNHANSKHLDFISSRWHKCTTCCFYFSTPIGLKLHNEKVACKFARKKKLSREHSNSPAATGTLQAKAKLPTNDRQEDRALPTDTFISYQNVRCAFCSMHLGDKKSYYKHVNEMHAGEAADIWFQCDTCPNFYPTEAIRNMHQSCSHSRDKQNRQGQIQTETLQHSKLPTSPGTIQAEVKLTTNDRREDCAPPTSSFTAEKNVCCAFCPMQSGDKKSYYQHVNEMHVAEVADIWFQCDTCPNFYPTEAIRNMHQSCSHSRDKQNRQGQIQTETLQHSKLPTSPGTIQAEVKLTTNDRREDCAPPTSSFTAEKNVCCAFCPMQSGDKKSYYQHVNEMHVAEVADIWFQCGICPNFYPTEVIRNMHYCYCKQSQSRRGLIQTEALQRSNVSSSIGSNQDDSVLDQEKCATTPTNSSMFSKTFSCQFCPAHGFGVRAYYIHVNSAHRDVAAKIWFKCEYCFRCQCYKHS